MSNLSLFEEDLIGEIGVGGALLDNEEGATEIADPYVTTPVHVEELNKNYAHFMNTPVVDGQPLTIGQVKCAVYLLLDADRQPLYVGQTWESLSGRTGRHITGQRSDAVAKQLLDPMEVVYIQVWLLPQYQDNPTKALAHLNALEFMVWRAAILKSNFGFVFNEKRPKKPAKEFDAPKPRTTQLLSDEVQRIVLQPNLRNARNADNIAALARIQAQRDVDPYYCELLALKLERLTHLVKVNNRKRSVA
jgi:hypothetical protein